MTVESGIDGSRLWFRIEDEAPPFDPRSHDPGPRLAADPAEGERGGFGLHLALRNLDDFAYARAGGRNRNTLIMRRPALGGATEGESGG